MSEEPTFIVTTKILTHQSPKKEHSLLPISGHPPATGAEMKWKTEVSFPEMLSDISLFLLSLLDKKPSNRFLNYRKSIPIGKKLTC